MQPPEFKLVSEGVFSIELIGKSVWIWGSLHWDTYVKLWITVLQILQDNAYVIGMQGDLDSDKCNHSEALQVPTATSRCATQESEGTQRQDTFACVKVEVSYHCQELYLKMEVLFTEIE